MTRKCHVRFGGRERDVLARGVTLPTQCLQRTLRIHLLSIAKATASPPSCDLATFLAPKAARELLLPEIERQQEQGKEVVSRRCGGLRQAKAICSTGRA